MLALKQQSPMVKPSYSQQQVWLQNGLHLATVRNIVTRISRTNASERPELEAFIHAVFQRAYGANVQHFMPQLMSLRNQQEQLLAVCGIRHAEHETLFLERYLAHPIEQVLAEVLGQSVDRADIVEVGNLAIANPVDIRNLLSSISAYLHGTDSQWAVFTAVPAIKNALIRLKLDVHTLGHASILDIPEDERADWGNYYLKQPQVIAIGRYLASAR
jgi:Thermostable hemolysin